MHTDEFAIVNPALTVSFRSSSAQGMLPLQEARQHFRNTFPISPTFRSTSARSTPLPHMGTPSPWPMLRSDSPSHVSPALREAADFRPSSELRFEARIPFRGSATPSSEVERGGSSASGSSAFPMVVERAGSSSFNGSVAGSAFQLASFRRNNYLSPATPEAPETVDSPSRRWWLDSERRAGQISGLTRFRNAGGSSSGSDVAAEDLVPERGRSAMSIFGEDGPLNTGNFRGIATPHRRRLSPEPRYFVARFCSCFEAALEQELKLSKRHQDSSGTW